MPRTGGRVDPDEDDLTVRDRRYESFGQQGVALATYVVPGHEAAQDHVEDGWGRGVDGVRLGDDLGEEASPSSSPQETHDERLRQRICGRLSSDPSLDTGELDVIVHHFEVTLGGTVPDAEQRKRVVAIAESVRGVVSVVDRVRVHKPR